MICSETGKAECKTDLAEVNMPQEAEDRVLESKAGSRDVQTPHTVSTGSILILATFLESCSKNHSSNGSSQ
jgi:hypothetical protein